MIDVVHDQLVFPLFSISELYHAYNSLGTIEVIKELTLHLVPIIDALRCKVNVLIKIALKCTNQNRLEENKQNVWLTGYHLYLYCYKFQRNGQHVVLDFLFRQMIKTLEVDP